MMSLNLLKLALVLVFLSSVFADDQVFLPDYPYSGRTYSGYLNLATPGKKLHYLFMPSQNSPSDDPLVLWLNGGPGCSSLLGWAQENGPACLSDDTLKFTPNEFSWNKKANMLWIESPAGVGFSQVGEGGDYSNDDVQSGQENLQAMLQFFIKYPEFRTNDFYVSGESYAGIYVPYLANEILEYNKDCLPQEMILLRGIMVGNGVTDWNLDTTAALYDFAWYHSLYSIELREQYVQTCVNETPGTICEKIQELIMNSLDGLNIYDILRSCYTPPTNQTKRKLTGFNKKHSYPYTPWLFANRERQEDIRIEFLQFLGEKKKLKETPPCVNSNGADSYFNREDVKKAFNVPEDITWNMCSEEVGNTYTPDFVKGSFWIYPNLFARNIKVLIYSGDTDAAVPITGTVRWINNLKLNVNEPYRHWRIDDQNVAGYVTEYNGLTFASVKGVGHMVPQWKRAEAFYMINQFITGKKL